MKRLAATLRLDARLQARYRVYTIVLAAAIALAAAMGALFSPSQLQFFMPVIVLSGVSMTTVFLVGFLVLLERDEGTLDVVLVSPLRSTEYLLSKVITLTALALVEGMVIAVVAFGLDFNLVWLALSIMMRAITGAAIGIVVGVRHRSITKFLVPAVFASLAFDIPNLWYLELAPTPLFYLWPSMPPLLFAKAAFFPVETWQLIYASVAGGLVMLASLLLAKRAIRLHVVGGGVYA